MNRDENPNGDTWVYESIVGAVPGFSLRPGLAIAVQFTAFEVAVIAVALWTDHPNAILPGTVAVTVAAVGSWVMLHLGNEIRALDPPTAYRRFLFGSSLEVVLTVFAYAALITHLFVGFTGIPSPVVESLLGGSRAPIAIFVLLVVLWDVCYRIGTSWWVAVASFYRAATTTVPVEASPRYRAIDATNVAFSVVQLALVPFILTDPILTVAVTGHVVAVAGVSVAATALDATEPS